MYLIELGPMPDLDWIVRPGYNLGGYILGCSQRLASCLQDSAQIGPDLLCHPSFVTDLLLKEVMIFCVIKGSDDFSCY